MKNPRSGSDEIERRLTVALETWLNPVIIRSGRLSEDLFCGVTFLCPPTSPPPRDVPDFDRQAV
jgi:hypothetical protein